MPIASGVESEVSSDLGFWRAWRVELSKLVKGYRRRAELCSSEQLMWQTCGLEVALEFVEL